MSCSHPRPVASGPLTRRNFALSLCGLALPPPGWPQSAMPWEGPATVAKVCLTPQPHGPVMGFQVQWEI